MNYNMVEEWKDIEGFEGCYQVSNLGRVRSLDRFVNYKDGRIFNYKGKILALGDCKGYSIIPLWINSKQKCFRVHRLVAAAFIPNPNNWPEVNHKDEIRTNNHVDNLEWCTPKYNTNYGTGIERGTAKQRKKIIGINLITNEQIIIKGVLKSKEYGFNPNAVNNCLKGRTKSSAGYTWMYYDEWLSKGEYNHA